MEIDYHLEADDPPPDTLRSLERSLQGADDLFSVEGRRPRRRPHLGFSSADQRSLASLSRRLPRTSRALTLALKQLTYIQEVPPGPPFGVHARMEAQPRSTCGRTCCWSSQRAPCSAAAQLEPGRVVLETFASLPPLPTGPFRPPAGEPSPSVAAGGRREVRRVCACTRRIACTRTAAAEGSCSPGASTCRVCALRWYRSTLGSAPQCRVAGVNVAHVVLCALAQSLRRVPGYESLQLRVSCDATGFGLLLCGVPRVAELTVLLHDVPDVGQAAQ